MKELIRMLEIMQGDETPAISFAKGDSERTTIRESLKRQLLKRKIKEA